MTIPGVILAVVGESESGIAQALAARSDVTVVRRCADLAEAAGAARAGIGRLVVVSDQPHLTREVVNDIRAAGARVLGKARSAAGADVLESLGVPCVGGDAASSEEVAEAIALAAIGHGEMATILEAPSPHEDSAASVDFDRDATVVAVWGPTGAPGRTTVALNLAAEVAAQGSSVVLIDADTYGGAVAQACGLLDESPGIAALARLAQRGELSAADLDVHSVVMAERLRVVTGIARPARWIELPAAALDEVWQAARKAADVVVIDCGFGLESDEDLTYDTRAPQRHGATLSALAAADVVLAVGTAEPLGIQRLIHGLADLREAGVEQPIVAVNRVRADVAGTRPEEAVADAMKRYAGIDQVWALPWDPRAADAATLAGQTLIERVPRSRLRHCIAALAAQVLAARVQSTPVESMSARTPVDARRALSH